MDQTAIILPPGVERPPPRAPLVEGKGMVVNETDLPTEAVMTYLDEHASLLGVSAGSTFQTYSNEGSLLARSKFRVPGNTFEEIVLARDMAERDDDCASAIGAMIAAAYSEGMQHQHRDQVHRALFDEIGESADLDMVNQELYREWLIAGSVTTASVFVREDFTILPEGAERSRTKQLVAPLIGVLPAEQIRILDNDLFRTGTLLYRPASGAQERWLEEFFDPGTSAGRRAEMRMQDPVLTTLLIEQIEVPMGIEDVHAYMGDTSDPPASRFLYRLNPRLVHRSSMPKGSWRYPRPPLTRNFALLEAKRLLNLMDFALLQGGSNFLVVAKKGSDQRPAQPEEVDNLQEVLKRSTRSGVLIGDHRLSIEIITPDLTSLLNAEKRRLLGRKLTQALMRTPDAATEDPGAEGARTEVEFATRVITLDRLNLRRHIQRGPYRETVRRNPDALTQGAATIWHPKIILQGTQYFDDYVIKLRDRGDIARRTAVEAAGYSWEAQVEQRRLERASGHDDVMMAPEVPFSGQGGPQDNNQGRPAGSGPNNGAPGARQRATPPARARPRRVVQRNAGETVRAQFDDDIGTYRVGELTYAVLEEFAETKKIGRLTPFEVKALNRIRDEEDWAGPIEEGPNVFVPVNPDYTITDIKAVRLTDGLSMLVGNRVDDDAVVARAFVFRHPATPLDAEEQAVQWGFPARPLLEPGDSDPDS